MLYHLIGRQTQTPLVRDYSEILASGEMNVVTDYNSIGYYVSGDTAAGFQLEMMRALEQEWGIKVNIYLENSLDANLQGLLEQQYDLVARYNLKEFGCPGGGCLLTDAAFSGRLRDFFTYEDTFTMLDVELLNTGRHFRIRPDAKMIIGRNKQENERLRSLWAVPYTLVYPSGFQGPLGILKGRVDTEVIAIGANIIAYYGKNRSPVITIESNDGSISRHEVERSDEDPERYKV